MAHPMKLIWFMWTMLPVLLTGCHRGPGVKIPAYDPQQAAQQAVETMDSNSDQLLSRDELAASPGLLSNLASIDQDADQQLSAAEIEQRVARYTDMGVGAMSVQCLVYWSGQPLVGAEISFVPETFMTDTVKLGKGRTRNDGSAALVTEDRFPGLSPGLYRVVISKMQSGQETIPARYNTATELGYEVTLDSTNARFDLE